MANEHDKRTEASPRPHAADGAPQHARPSVAGSRRVHQASKHPRSAATTGPLRPAEQPADSFDLTDRTPARRSPTPHRRPTAQNKRTARGVAMPVVSAEKAHDQHERAARSRNPEHTPASAPAGAPAPLGNRVHLELSRRTFIAGGVAIAGAVAVVGIPAFIKSRPITLNVNGQEIELKKTRTVQAALEASGAQPTPGNLIDVAGEIYTEGGGTPYVATLNGTEVTDAETRVANGDTLTFADGRDVEEPSTVEDKEVAAPAVESGYGPIHQIESQGASGVSTVKTGQTSGKEVVLEVITPTEDRVYRRSYPDTQDDKAIALTFDDGPWETTTAEILDVLRDNGAVATFFTVGTRIAGEGVDLVKREYDEGHQVCTHSWDHAAGSGQGVNLSFMSPDEQRSEIEQGRQAIADATGAEASRVIRAPGGNFPLEVWRNVEDLVDADIGWDIDTLDWKRPGVGAIVAQLKKATPGDIILMHDGGGDRSQTAEALREALPFLKEQGFRFVTMDEMMQFPRKDA